jgi:Mg-chelatase subunit ChlD
MTAARRAHQQTVAALLHASEERRQQMTVLQAYGVRAAGLNELTRELDELRANLATALRPDGY